MKGRKNVKWNGGVECTCGICGRRFTVNLHRFKKGKVRFCSSVCLNKWQSLYRRGKNNAFYGRKHTKKSIEQQIQARNKALHVAPNGAERRFIKICHKYDLPYDFVGDGSLIIHGLNPDFSHRERKEVIEIFADYWHSPLFRANLKLSRTLPGRKEIFENQGYILKVLWEDELKDERRVLLKLGLENMIVK